MPLAAVTPDEVDRLLGAVLENADGSFNTLLELGFASAIRKEYAWRVSRGESTRNLDAFTHLTQRRRGSWTQGLTNQSSRRESTGPTTFYAEVPYYRCTTLSRLRGPWHAHRRRRSERRSYPWTATEGGRR